VKCRGYERLICCYDAEEKETIATEFLWGNLLVRLHMQNRGEGEFITSKESL
jgi:hypothetical protein